MLQPFHRGIYEYLWSEHKYVALGYSLKAYNNSASKLTTPRQCLTFLKKLLNFALAERPEHLSSLLSAYMHIKPHLSRQEREVIIKALLADENDGAEKIFAAVLRFAEATMYGCRLFYPGSYAIYKFWDVQHHPGLWLCLGTFQLHLSPEEIFSRAMQKGNYSKDDWVNACNQLKHGVSAKKMAEWPAALVEDFLHNNMMARAGKTLWLHPRADFAYAEMQIEKSELDLPHLAGLILESHWDQAEAGNETIATTPSLADCERLFAQLMQENLESSHSPQEVFTFLEETFSQLDSAPGIGVEAAYQEINSEQGEHGNDEAEH